MAWDDMRKPDKISAVFNPVEKLLKEIELVDALRWRLSRQEVAEESYPETRSAVCTPNSDDENFLRALGFRFEQLPANSLGSAA